MEEIRIHRRGRKRIDREIFFEQRNRDAACRCKHVQGEETEKEKERERDTKETDKHESEKQQDKHETKETEKRDKPEIGIVFPTTTQRKHIEFWKNALRDGIR